MRAIGLVALACILLGVEGCAGHGGQQAGRDIALSPAYGSSLQGVDWFNSGDVLVVSFASLDRAGRMVHIALPSDTRVVGEDWTNDSRTVHLCVPVPDGAELGVVPLASFGGGAVTAEFKLGNGTRIVSKPPIYEDNVVTDLTATELDPSHVRLAWTEVNKGDYDFNGEVNLADLNPLAVGFGNSVDRLAPDAREQAAYWVDGDGNGLINLADIQPIGGHFKSQVSGYVVQRNGLPVEATGGGLPTVQHVMFQRIGLPTIYSIELGGTGTDDWSVVSVDVYGTEGSGSDQVVVDQLDVRASLQITGVDLFDLSPIAGSGPFDYGRYFMRVVYPGDFPDRLPIVPPIEGPLGVVFFNNLPRDRQYVLDIVYSPVVNLSTGVATTSSYQVVTSVPFELKTGTDQLGIDTSISIVPNPNGGYFVDPTTQESSVGPPVETTTRLDIKDGFVSTDTDHNGSLADEASLADSDRDSVSNALLEQRVDYDTYRVYIDGELQPVDIEATVTGFNEADGRMTLVDAVQLGELRMPLPDEPILMRFSEMTRFEELVNPGLDQFERNFDPSTIQVGDRVEIKGYRVANLHTLLPFKYWANAAPTTSILRYVQVP
jgi:hypothetical protein